MPPVLRREILLAAAVLLLASLAGAQAKATIQKPKTVTVTGGRCLLKTDGTLGVNIGPNATMPTLAFPIGPGAFMADSDARKQGEICRPWQVCQRDRRGVSGQDSDGGQLYGSRDCDR